MGRNSKNMEWKQVVTREKTKFKQITGKKKVKLGKRRGAKYRN